jgi:hypothetical protein
MSNVSSALLKLINHPLAGAFLKRTSPAEVTFPMIATLVTQIGGPSDVALVQEILGVVNSMATDKRNMAQVIEDPKFIIRVDEILRAHEAGTLESGTTPPEDPIVVMCRHCGEMNIYEVSPEAL